MLVGAGHAHVGVLRAFGMRPLPGARLTLITREVHTPYSGMLPGLVAGRYGFDETHIDAGPLARFAGARLFHDEATGLDLDRRLVICRGRPPVPYDLLSLDVGSAPGGLVAEGGAATPVKPIGRFVERWRAILRRASTASGRGPRIAVVGAGMAGVELVLAIRHGLAAATAGAGGPAELVLVGRSAKILPGVAEGARRRLARALEAAGVRVLTGREVVAVEGGTLRFAGGPPPEEADEVVWATAGAGASWLAASGLAVDAGGFARVDPCLRSVSRPEVYVAGDAAALSDPRPKAGVFAVRAAAPLAHNLRRSLQGRPPRPVAFQRRWLALVSTGDGRAVAARGGWSAEGAWVWRWKDRIDRRFVRRYADFPAMPEAPVPDVPSALPEAASAAAAARMRCGGCGAKVGADVLSRVLAGLPRAAASAGRDDIVLGLDEPDDAAAVRVPPGRVVVQSVDHFRAFVDDPYLSGRIAAHHALSDLFATGAEPQTALAIVTVPHGPDRKVEEELSALLAGAVAVLDEAGAALVGGHTGEGAELALGFAVGGHADPARLTRKGGMRPGDRLVLTKALGTGTILAAEMRGRARARWTQGALRSMDRSNGPAALALRRYEATACTDVTGFGLLGHLLEMAKASGVAAEVDAAAVPALDGALDALRQGLASSLQPQNERLAAAVGGCAALRAADPARLALLYDPQTSGGLLASVPAGEAEACLAALHAGGDTDARVVGEVTVRDPGRPEPVGLRT